ncbi:MAG TPA: hypothetical protein RMI62_13250, partial [Polyangiaceae bacterium LLY-WYZ-15_(1-7)]|nr:hypothetical protein [Polyangiaceae bacterium LLY-WYZ-15_(1-7)]
APAAAPQQEKKSKVGMWIGIGVGCLVLAFAVVFGSCWYCKSKVEEGMTAAGAELSRISLSFALSGIKLSCVGDPSGAGASNYFHPQVFSQYQGVACQVNDQVIDAFGTACNQGQQPCSNAQMISGTADESRATDLGLNVAQCYVYTSGQAKIVGCSGDQGFKIIHMENVTAVQ